MLHPGSRIGSVRLSERRRSARGTVLRTLRAFTQASTAGMCFLGFWSGSVILSWIVLPAFRVAHRRLPEVQQTRRCQDIVGRAFRLFMNCMRYLRLVEFRPATTRLDLPQRPFVMLANHPTLVDVTAIMSVFPRICCVAKKELFDSYQVGRLLRYCGHISSGEGTSLEGTSVIQQALDRLEAGQPVLIFPEGTRSPEYGLRKFRAGVVEVALRANVPLVPVLVTCDPPTLLKGLTWYGLPKRCVTYRLTRLPTIQARDMTGGARAAAERIQATFQEQIDDWKSRTGFAGRP